MSLQPKPEKQPESQKEDKLVFTLNGASLELAVPAERRMVDVLRDDLGLTGTKLSCEIGRCGACMVLVDGQPMNACLLMAYQVRGRTVTTIEGITGEEGGLHPVQQAFLEEGGFQCGYCTPGMVVSMVGLLGQCLSPNRDDVREALSGNLCRCTGYGGILRAADAAVQAMCGRGSGS